MTYYRPNARCKNDQILDVGTSWEEPRLHEHPNDYVDETCHFLRMMWHSLLNDCRLPVAATSVVWRNLVECAYAAMLDGFARVPFCSTEGRALMSMDVSTFASGLADRSAIGGPYAGDEPPPQVTSNWGQRHVDTFIKIFYFPPTVRSQYVSTRLEMGRRLTKIVDTGCICLD